jgi:hypothetical protein
MHFDGDDTNQNFTTTEMRKWISDNVKFETDTFIHACPTTGKTAFAMIHTLMGSSVVDTDILLDMVVKESRNTTDEEEAHRIRRSPESKQKVFQIINDSEADVIISNIFTDGMEEMIDKRYLMKGKIPISFFRYPADIVEISIERGRPIAIEFAERWFAQWIISQNIHCKILLLKDEFVSQMFPFDVNDMLWDAVDHEGYIL